MRSLDMHRRKIEPGQILWKGQGEVKYNVTEYQIDTEGQALNLQFAQSGRPTIIRRDAVSVTE